MSFFKQYIRNGGSNHISANLYLNNELKKNSILFMHVLSNRKMKSIRSRLFIIYNNDENIIGVIDTKTFTNFLLYNDYSFSCIYTVISILNDTFYGKKINLKKIILLRVIVKYIIQKTINNEKIFNIYKFTSKENKFISENNINIIDEIQRYPNIFIEQINNKNFYTKYLKYKQKYLQIKYK
jgi:hypothetical protein